MRLKRPLRHRMHEKRAGSCTLTPHSEASQAYSSYRRRESPGVTSSPPPTSMSLCGSPYSGFGFWGQQRILTATEGERKGGRGFQQPAPWQAEFPLRAHRDSQPGALLICKPSWWHSLTKEDGGVQVSLPRALR